MTATFVYAVLYLGNDGWTVGGIYEQESEAKRHAREVLASTSPEPWGTKVVEWRVC